jgi:hypothetical protein
MVRNIYCDLRAQLDDLEERLELWTSQHHETATEKKRIEEKESTEKALRICDEFSLYVDCHVS